MFTLSIFIVLNLIRFSCGVPIEYETETVAIDLAIPRGQTRDEYLKSIVDYWTPERMASALSKDAIVYNENELLRLGNEPKVVKAATVLADSALMAGMASKRPKVAGKVYFSMNGSNYMCSASVVNAMNRDTIVTAGHCVFEYERKIWATNWVFIPEYLSNSRPFGTFTMRKLSTLNRWMTSRDFNYDVGVVLVNPNDKGQHVQDVVGGLGITLDAPKRGAVVSFGYPKNLNNGEIVSNCDSLAVAATSVFNFVGLQLPCAMTGGSSGGPWIQEYDADERAGQQISVNSFIISNRQNTMFGPHFVEANIGSLYRQYQDK